AATGRLLAEYRAGTTIAALIADYRPAVQATLARLRQNGGVEAVTALIDARDAVIATFDQVKLARLCGHPLPAIETALASLRQQLDVDWLAAAIQRLPAGNRWQARARAQLTDDLARLRQHLLQQVLAAQALASAPASAILDELKANAPQDLAMLSSGLAEIRQLLS
ncbi:MAG TPA: NAD-glutamate dehydrogenase, partial [Accumulibacter sp.]|nr:NAD-glutamate dehydrogenase [Accumulibacter sp.]